MTVQTPAAPSDFPLRAPVVFVTGKGGVGKTTVAAALALQASHARLHPALVEFDDGESGNRALGPHAAELAHIVLSYDRALIDTLGSLLGARILARALVSQRALRRLIRAVPALREFVFLDRIRALAAEGIYRPIIVDLPSSGHALDWLRVPHAFERFLGGKSPLGAMGRRIHQEIVAPQRCDVVVVTLAEPMVIKETEELCTRMQHELGTKPSLVVVNRASYPDPQQATQAALQVADSCTPLASSARQLLQVLQARRDLAHDTQNACQLARSLQAGHITSVPDAVVDPSPLQVASWLFSGAVS